MKPIDLRIAEELGVRAPQVAAAISLLDSGATVPFVARYRKEAIGALDDTQLRRLGFTPSTQVWLPNKAMPPRSAANTRASHTILAGSAGLGNTSSAQATASSSTTARHTPRLGIGGATQGWCGRVGLDAMAGDGSASAAMGM
jgi:Tex-like protein N-terminal domain